ncbi:MAG TPA: FtsX-like permease family protein [Sphingobacteriaceae bacterium]|nr:FtsX-like permease family protein [Sphingobacteriaceae bacterium]
MNFPFYLAKRITLSGQRTFSGLIVRVAVITVSVGVAAMILAIAILNGFKEEVSRKQRGFFGDITITDTYSYQALEQQPILLEASKLEELAEIPGVRGLRKFATKPGIITVNGEVEGVVLKGLAPDYDQTFLQEILTGGQPLDFSDSTAVNGQVLISQYTAQRLDLQVGDDFIMYFVQEPIRRRKFIIQGIFNTSSEELDKTYVVGAMALITRLNDWDEREVGGIELQIDNFDQLALITEQINQQIPINLAAVNLIQRFPEIFQWLDLLDANPQIILTLMMIVALINMISALLIIILEKTQLIGLLKAFGATNARIRSVFLYQAAYLMGLGLLIGNMVALGIYFFQKSTRFFTLDESSYFVSYVPVDISWMEVLALNAGVMVISVLVLLLPAILISKINPIRTIQFR